MGGLEGEGAYSAAIGSCSSAGSKFADIANAFLWLWSGNYKVQGVNVLPEMGLEWEGF